MVMIFNVSIAQIAQAGFLDFINSDCHKLKIKGKEGRLKVKCCNVMSGVVCRVNADSYVQDLGAWPVKMDGYIDIDMGYEFPFLIIKLNGFSAYGIMGRVYNVQFNELKYWIYGFYLSPEGHLKCANKIDGELYINDKLIPVSDLLVYLCQPFMFLPGF